MSNLTINVGSMIVNGVTIGNQAMDASNRKLKLYEPEHGPESKAETPDQTRLIVAEVLKQLRESETQLPGQPDVLPLPSQDQSSEPVQNDGGQGSMKRGTSSPARVNLQHSGPESQSIDGQPQLSRVTLRNCFDRVLSRRVWASNTTYKYRSVVDH